MRCVADYPHELFFALLYLLFVHEVVYGDLDVELFYVQQCLLLAVAVFVLGQDGPFDGIQYFADAAFLVVHQSLLAVLLLSRHWELAEAAFLAVFEIGRHWHLVDAAFIVAHQSILAVFLLGRH